MFKLITQCGAHAILLAKSMDSHSSTACGKSEGTLVTAGGQIVREERRVAQSASSTANQRGILLAGCLAVFDI